jgi:transposase
MHTTIKTLFQRGKSKSEIARILGVDRKTVRNILNKPDDAPIEKRPHPSMLDPYMKYIQEKINLELSATRIWQDLQQDFSFKGQYTTVRDYVRKLKKSDKKAFMVLHSLCGEEAQVDFGYIGTLKVDGKYRKAWVFVIVLSYSRYMYAQIVLDQSVKTFIQCHSNAMKYFGGVPQVVKIDNLKAGIIEANFYEPLVQRTYASFAAHYGFLPQPCRIYTPTDKGKVESGVDYVKDNGLKGRNFKDYQEACDFLKHWLRDIANVRVHGTTRKIPQEVFEQEEKAKLGQLPVQDFIFSSSQKASLNTNCHLSYKGVYYSAPYQYIGMELDVIEVNSLLKIYYQNTELAVHIIKTTEKGGYVTDAMHYPTSKNITIRDIQDRQRLEMAEIGSGAASFYEAFMCRDGLGKYEYRSITGILALRKKYDNTTINEACKRALYYNSLTYIIVKKICEKGLVALGIQHSESYLNDKPTDVARNLVEYRDLCEMGGLCNE